MVFGYLADLADAEDYFADERMETACWDDLGSGSAGGLKEKALVMGYNRLYYDARWTLPTYATASAAELDVLRKANCEMAYYLCCHLEDEDRRKGIQAQGVVGANVVGETYVRFKSDSMQLTDVPVPPVVISWLTPWLVEIGTHFGAIDLARDEEESVNTKVHNF